MRWTRSASSPRSNDRRPSAKNEPDNILLYACADVTGVEDGRQLVLGDDLVTLISHARQGHAQAGMRAASVEWFITNDMATWRLGRLGALEGKRMQISMIILGGRA